MSAALVLAVSAAYWNCLDVPFVFDDFRTIVSCPGVRTLQLPAGDRNLHFDSRPVGRWTLWLNYSLHRLDVCGYHLFNVGVHAAATLALFGLVRRTLLLPPSAGRSAGSPKQADWIALAIALLWCLHPLQTQAVTYVIQRLESLMAIFFLLALYCLVRGSQSRRAGLWNLAAVAAGWLSVGSKEVGAMLPLVALAYDWTFLADSWRERLRKRGLVYAGLAGAVIWFAVTLHRKFDAGLDISHGITAWDYFRSQPGVIWHYLRLAVWPDVLVLDYAWPVAQHWQQIVPPGLALTVLFAAGLYGCCRKRAWGFLTLTFFLVLAPSSSFLPIVDLAYEHRMYLPLATVVAAVVLAAAELCRRWERFGAVQPVALALLGVIAIAFGWRTVLRNQDWRDPCRLWAANLCDRPLSYRAAGNLAIAQMERGEIEASLANARRAMALKPSQSQLYGSLLLQAHRPTEALEPLRLAVELEPHSARSLRSLAQACETLGRLDEAERYYGLALAEDPAAASDQLRYANLLVRLGRHAEASDHFRAGCNSEPRDAQYPLQFGTHLAKLGDYRGAIVQFREVIRLEPANAQAHLGLALALFDSGDLSGSTRIAAVLLRLKPDSQAARELLRRIDAAQRSRT